jgi:hypothetical protein
LAAGIIVIELTGFRDRLGWFEHEKLRETKNIITKKKYPGFFILKIFFILTFIAMTSFLP